MNIVEIFGSTAATLGGGFFIGILIGYAVKKVIKIVTVLVGLFLAGLAYLQYNQIINVNWNKLQAIFEGTITTLSNLTMQIPGISAVCIGAGRIYTIEFAADDGKGGMCNGQVEVSVPINQGQPAYDGAIFDSTQP